jgi:hypothetical protein
MLFDFSGEAQLRFDFNLDVCGGVFSDLERNVEMICNTVPVVFGYLKL